MFYSVALVRKWPYTS